MQSVEASIEKERAKEVKANISSISSRRCRKQNLTPTLEKDEEEKEGHLRKERDVKEILLVEMVKS